MTGSRADVVVIGGGVIGLSVAWKASLAGRSVTVFDPNPGQGASWASAGMIASTTEARWGEERLHALALASAVQWPAFAAELQEASGVDVGLRTEGTLSVAFDQDDHRALVEAVEVQRNFGCRSELLSGRECRELEPSLNPRLVGGALGPDDHQVDNRAVVRALLEAVTRSGAEMRRVGVQRLVTEQRAGTSGARVTGVVLADGSSVLADSVVLAAGCHSAAIEGVPAADVPPVRPVKGQILRLHAGNNGHPVTRTVRALVQGRSVYLVPRANGEIVVGATVEERGFDTTVTAGAVHELLRAAVLAVPEVAELELAEAIARLRPGSPDNGPILGWAFTEGLLVATGHFRHGVLLAPVTAQAAGELLAGREICGPASGFSPERFNERPGERPEKEVSLA